MRPKNIMAKIQITPGDLADRISILEIKKEKSFCDEVELEELMEQWKLLGVGRSYINDMKAINLEGWGTVERIYEMFDEMHCVSVDKNECFNVCRTAHMNNKMRVTFKNYINKCLGVDRQEIKTWTPSTI